MLLECPLNIDDDEKYNVLSVSSVIIVICADIALIIVIFIYLLTWNVTESICEFMWWCIVVAVLLISLLKMFNYSNLEYIILYLN